MRSKKFKSSKKSREDPVLIRRLEVEAEETRIARIESFSVEMSSIQCGAALEKLAKHLILLRLGLE